MAAKKPPQLTIRQYRNTDDAQVWALAALGDMPAPAAKTAPVPLPDADQPPPELPDLADIADRFLRAGGDFLVAEVGGHLVGTAGLLPAEGNMADVVLVRVHPALRRRGIGTALLEAVERRAEGLGVHRLNLDVGDAQPDAVAFYLASGFHEHDAGDEPAQERELSLFSKALKFLP